MIITLISTIVLLMALMVGWIEVQRAARRVAEQHPEAGPLRLIGGGCGGHCGGCGESCETADPSPSEGRAHVFDVQELR
jgi:hypothetical protein